MKKLFMLAFAGILLATAGCSNPKEAGEQNKPVEKQPVTKKMLRHIVLLKFKEAASADDVRKVEDAFRKLPSEIKEIKDFEWGTNNSPEGLADGFTHAFFVSFESEADREVYLPHPRHAAFVEVLKPHLDKALVVDYWADK